MRLEQMQALLKTEPEETHDEIVDVITVTPPCQALKVKEEEQEADIEPKFFLGPSVSAQFVSEAAHQVGSFRGHRRLNKGLHRLVTSRLFQIGVNFQPLEVEKNVFAPVVEEMILKVGQTQLIALAQSSLTNEEEFLVSANVNQCCCFHCQKTMCVCVCLGY